jgi:hypothetical protein
MSRFLIVCALAVSVLFACGRVITISIPGGPPGPATTVAQDGALPRGYERFLSPASHNFRFSWPGEPARRGQVAERYELRDGDCADTDCANNRLRAELRESPNAQTAKAGKDIWYGWSFYNDTVPAVTHDTRVGLILGQWKLDGDQPPPLRIAQVPPSDMNWASCDPTICNPIGAANEDVVAELEDMHITQGWGATQNYGDVCRLFSMAENKGKWVDIVVNTNFAADGNGYLRIWINGKLRCNYYGQMVAQGKPGAALSHRRGLFASYTKTWRDKQGATPIPTMVAYYDEFRSGAKREDVDPALRETAALRPND